jgi:hypothetical protein
MYNKHRKEIEMPRFTEQDIEESIIFNWKESVKKND